MGPSKNKKNIMVVDDHPANLRLLGEVLRQQGYGVRSFPRGRLALAAAAEDPPDLILLDINMPEMDGFEVCRRLRSDAALSSIPVIFLSALNQTEDKLAAFRSGGFDYVTKPFEPEEVQARIETQIELRELRARVERQNHDLESLVKQQVREIADGQMSTIFALAKLADSRDNETGGHLERVQMLCRFLAVEMSAGPNYSGTITDDYVQNIQVRYTISARWLFPMRSFSNRAN
jgi:putative two-component system response regulator